MEQDALEGNVGEAQHTGECQRNHKELDPGLELVGGFAQVPAVGEGTHDGVVDGVPQAGHQEQTGHPGGADAQYIGAEGEEIGVYKQVDKAAGHIAEDIAQFIAEAERAYRFGFHLQFSLLSY